MQAVLAEAQMMNTIEYRMDCQLLKYLHEENNLGHRFPIGMVDQVKQWPKQKLHAFWRKWCAPFCLPFCLRGSAHPLLCG